MKSKLVAEWVAKAEEDFLTVEILARQRKKRIHNSVCFHAQQCAEKYLKARLEEAAIGFAHTHDLLMLHYGLNEKRLHEWGKARNEAREQP